MSLRDDFVRELADAKAEFSAEHLLKQLCTRFAGRTDYSLAPITVARILDEVYQDVQRAKQLAAARTEQPQ